jgi:hypothetical protein
MRSLVVNAALLDASIITMAMAFIVFFTLVCASKPPIFFWFAPSFSFYYGCLAFGNLSDFEFAFSLFGWLRSNSDSVRLRSAGQAFSERRKPW